MPDVMMFPDTVEEFMESYKVTDVEHIYSNGVEYVPINRMRQWFQHQPERKKGKWIKKEKCYPDIEKQMDYRYECSECGFSDIHNATLEVPFCWHCGADMRGDTWEH